MATNETKIKITADVSSAERDIKKLEQALDNIGEAAGITAKALGGLTAAATAVAFAVIKTLDSAGQLIDVAKALGVSAQSLQAMQHAAHLAGVSTEELNGALQRMSANIGDAVVKGAGPAKDAIERLGVSLNTLQTQRPDQQFKTLAEALAGIQNPAERAAVATDLFGKGMAQKALEVAKGVEQARHELEKMGLALSDFDVAALDKAGDSVDELAGLFDSALKKAVADIAPYVVAIVEKIKEAIEAAGGFEAVWQKVKSAIREALNIAILTAAIAALGSMVMIVGNLVVAIRNAKTAMELFNAVVKRNPLMLAVGAALLLAKVLGVDVVQYMDEYLGLSSKVEEVNKDIAEDAKKITEENNKAVEAVKGYNQEQQKALKALEDTLVKLEQSVQFEKDKLEIGEAQANINKAIAEESAKLAKVGLTLNDQQKERITNAYNELQAIKDQAALNKVIKDLEAERLYVTIADKNEREIAQTITKQELELKRSLTDAEKERLTNAIKLTQQAREQGQIAEAIYNYTRQQTELEKINRGIQLQSQVAPRMVLDKEYAKDEEALKAMLDRKLISEMEYYAQREELAKQYNQKVQDIEMKRIEDVLMKQTGAIAVEMSERDKAIVQAVGQQERQKAIVAERLAFEKKSEVEKAAFVIDQGAQMFSALGAHNKRAFEAAKAFNIANAIMNTYMAATKALATYPWPFGLVAAAAAVGMGLAQVAQIRAQQYSGRQLGGPVMGGQTYMVGENGPELFTPNTTGSITRNSDLPDGKTVNVNFTIVANDTTGFDQLLASRKGVITQIINDAVLEKGRRNIA